MQRHHLRSAAAACPLRAGPRRVLRQGRAERAVGYGSEYVNLPRKPLSEYVGASIEFTFPGGPEEPIRGTRSLCELYKIRQQPRRRVAARGRAEARPHGHDGLPRHHGPEPGLRSLPGARAPKFSAVHARRGGRADRFVGCVRASTRRDSTTCGTARSTSANRVITAGARTSCPRTRRCGQNEAKGAQEAALMIAFMGIAMNHFIPGVLPGCIYN